MDTEFIVPAPCGRLVCAPSTSAELGFCVRPEAHDEPCTHLIGKTIVHNLHKRDGQVTYR